MLIECTALLLFRPSQRLHSVFWRQVASVFPSPYPPLSFPLFYRCDRCLGLMAGLPGFASHGSSLNLGAGCQ